MIKVALVVEGQGDEAAFPVLVARICELYGQHLIAPNPIRSGGLNKLERPGEIERFAVLAASRADVQRVIIVADIDDGCPVEKARHLQQRVASAEQRFAKPIHVCLAVREFEGWLLCDLDNIRQLVREYPWKQEVVCEDGNLVRGAKEHLGRAMGRRYREPIDQAVLSRHINVHNVAEKSRSFRKFIKAVTGLSYERILGVG
jgi:hypothetical protein